MLLDPSQPRAATCQAEHQVLSQFMVVVVVEEVDEVSAAVVGVGVKTLWQAAFFTLSSETTEKKKKKEE